MITIGILFFNENKHEIYRLFRALTRQTLLEFNLIIIVEPRVNGLQDFEEFYKFRNVKIILNDLLKGTVKNRNRILRDCSSQYLVFIDGDDFVDRNFVKQINDALKGNADLFYFNYIIKTEFSKTLINLKNSNIIHDTLQDWKILGCSVFKVDVVRKLQGYNHNGFEDVDLILRMISYGYDDFLFIPGTTYFWMKKESGRNSQSTLLDTANLMQRNIAVFKKYNSPSQFKDKYFGVMLTYWRDKKFKDCFLILLKARLVLPLIFFITNKVFTKKVIDG
jgi:hypothetical protein